MNVIRILSLVLPVCALAGAAFAQAPDPVSEKAAVFMTYQADVDKVGAEPFRSSTDIDQALTTLGGYNADQLTRGWISYSALIASQDPEFRRSVQDIEAYYGRERVMDSFAKGGSYARSLAGGDNAVSAAIAVTDSELPRIYNTAAIVKEQGYSLQGYGWAKTRIRDGGRRAEAVKLLQGRGQSADNMILAALAGLQAPAALAPDQETGVTMAVASAAELASAVRLPAFLTGEAVYGRTSVKYGKEPVANQIASVAALRILGASSVDETQLSRVMLEPGVQSCMKMQNLQLQGCVAGVGQEFEVPHCISQHALAEIADCLGAVYR